MRRSSLNPIPNAQTTPELVIEWAQEILDRSQNVWYPGGANNTHWPVKTATQAKWRDVNFDEGFLPQGDPWAVPALFLEVVALGVNPNAAAKSILLCSPLIAKNWSANALWKDDLLEAREVGRKVRMGELEERVVDALERKLPGAEYKDVVALAKMLGERGDRKFNEPLPPPAPQISGPTLQFLGSPEQQAATALALVAALDRPIEAEYTVVDDARSD